LVFDLRDNSGGLLRQGIDIADLFLKRGKIVSVRSRNRGDEPSNAHRRPYWDVPLTVLVNDGSASASEIVASAIQDNQRGLLVGDRTFGKASVQQLMDPIPQFVERKYWIKLTVARYYSPSGRTIQVVGVNPELRVPPEAGGDYPLGYREEDLSNYLKPIEAVYQSPNQRLAGKVKACSEKRGIAEQIHAADPNPQIKFDFQLMKAADYLECAIDLQAQEATTTAHE
jgi:C-terminal processing protease CtpA/Prc